VSCRLIDTTTACEIGGRSPTTKAGRRSYKKGMLPTSTGTAARSFTMRVLTVNIHKGLAFLSRRVVLPQLRDAVRTVHADLVFLQEVQGGRADDEFADDASAAVHYEFLADEVWPQYAYGRNAVYPRGHHGNALLSKYPIERYDNHDASVDGHEPRGLLHCVVQPPQCSEPVHAICVHLGLREAHRERQLEMLCATIRAEVPESQLLVVAGDFNDWRHRAHRRLESCAGLQEVFVQAHGAAARTYPAGLPLLSLDRIYVRNAAAHAPIVLPRRPWSRLSDHAPLAAEIRQ
jgi:endonuclease/exonuclease/phosphatase family metal-dependent hydrolase